MAGEAPAGAILAPTAAVVVKEGQVMKVSSNLMTQAASRDDVCSAIAAKSSLYDGNTELTLDSGDLWPYYWMGSGKVVNVRSLTGQTWRFGAAVYNCQTASEDGCVETTSTSATKIGHYVGPDNVLTSGVTLIRVILDVAGGATS